LTTGQCNSFKGRRGFTLFELLIVMVLVAIAMGIAAPTLGLFTGSRHIKNSSACFLALADYGRSQAISEGRPYRLNIDTEKGIFWLTVQANGDFEMLGSEMGREFLLPEGVEIKMAGKLFDLREVEVPGLRLPGQHGSIGSPVEDGGIEHVTFYPDGHTQTGRFRMTDRRGNALDIVCLYPSGRFRIMEAEEGNNETF